MFPSLYTKARQTVNVLGLGWNAEQFIVSYVLHANAMVCTCQGF